MGNPKGLQKKSIQVGVISDTHLMGQGWGRRALFSLVERHFAEADMILHAGDIVDPDLLNLFAPKTVHAVRGNLDPPNLPLKKIVEINKKRIGLIHGWGAKGGLEQRILQEFATERLDCIVYGHSHRAACHVVDGILLFNPGSPTEPREAPFPSVGLLTVGSSISGEILPL